MYLVHKIKVLLVIAFDTIQQYSHVADYIIAGSALYQCTRQRRWMHWHTSTYDAVRFGIRIDPCYHIPTIFSSPRWSITRLHDQAHCPCLCIASSYAKLIIISSARITHCSACSLTHSRQRLMHVSHVRFPTSLPIPRPAYMMHDTRRYFPLPIMHRPLMSSPDQLRLLGILLVRAVSLHFLHT